ncbi:MAG: hypothetical protein ACOYMA_09685 [Bacteroidia bacterium]
MKVVKRNFLVQEEKLRFNAINDYQRVLYFNPNHFNLKDHVNLHFEYLEVLAAGNIKIVARYIDTSKSMEFYEPLEFFEEITFPFSEVKNIMPNIPSVSLKIKDDAKLLWKIGIQIFPRHETLLHLSIT